MCVPDPLVLVGQPGGGGRGCFGLSWRNRGVPQDADGREAASEGRAGSRRWHFVTIFTLVLPQCETFGSPPLAEGISYFITSRQDNLSNFAWKKSLTKHSKATIMPDETVIEFAFLLVSRLSLCWF